MNVLSIDIETYSTADIAKGGVYKYVEADDFRIMLFAYKVDNQPVQIVDLTKVKLPAIIEAALVDPRVLKTAYNANFERVCLSKHLGIQLDPAQWDCTMIRASRAGWPMNLGATAKAMGLQQEKMESGKALIRYFSIPCKPTKANGGRARNLPQHAPEKWEEFMAYCVQDVVVESEIRSKVIDWYVPKFETLLWNLDQRINDAGIELDMQFVNNAIDINTGYVDKLHHEAVMLTGLENPNSVSQIIGWMNRQGEAVETLRKADVKELLEGEIEGDARRLLEIRQEMAKTSVKKYAAMQQAVGRDSRVRGLFQFYGANRTGRWGGRLIQPQNLPQNHIKDLELARNVVRSGDGEALELLYGNVPDTLSQLIRTAFVAGKGKRFIVADFSAIEARVIAWLAGEQWRLDVFNTHGKIYEASASQMFGIPLEEITKGSDLRQKGKVAELACIAEGQLVLTDTGLIPIEKVDIHHKVWDGLQWVSHEGVIFKGVKSVITYGGLTATEDHLVWIEGQSNPIYFGIAAASGAHLVKSGDSGANLWLGENHESRKALGKEMARCTRVNRVRKLRKRAVVTIQRAYVRKIKRLPILLSTSAHSEVVGSKTYRCKTALHEPQRQKLPQLWGTGDRVQIQFGSRRRTLDTGKHWFTQTGLRARSHRYGRALRTRQYSICYTGSKPSKSSINGYSGMESGRVAILLQRGCEKDFGGPISRGNIRRCKTGGPRKAQKLALNRRKAATFDLINAGPNHRFTVSNVLVHNCGYQGGVGALQAMGATEMGLSKKELKAIITQWRKANPAIVELWNTSQEAAYNAIQYKGQSFEVRGVKMRVGEKTLNITLPSGRMLCYVNPRIVTIKYWKVRTKDTEILAEYLEDPTVETWNYVSASGKMLPFMAGDEAPREKWVSHLVYDGMDQTTKQWKAQETYGGKLVENIVQAIARDCLAVSMLRLDDAGYKIALHVHDEVVLEMPYGKGSIEEVNRIMGLPIKWAPGLPLKAESFETEFYKKD